METRTQFVATRYRPAAELVQERLQEIATHFGRLAYLARCVDVGGRYRHDGLQLTHDRTSVDRALAAAHEECFAAWIGLSLQQQHEDLSAFLEGLNRRRALHAWKESDPWRALSPRAAEAPERELFASDLRALIAQMLASLELVPASLEGEDEAGHDHAEQQPGCEPEINGVGK